MFFLGDSLLESSRNTARSTDGGHGHGKTWHGWRKLRLDGTAGSRLRNVLHDEVSGLSKFTELGGCRKLPNRAIPAN